MAVDRITLLSNASATGNAVNVPIAGQWMLILAGTVSGATISLQILASDGSSYVTVANSSLTATGTATVPLPAGSSVKAAVSGGTPSGLYAALDYAAK